jgi:MFS family permease
MQTRFRWVVIALIFFITLVNYVDRSALSYAVQGISTEFGFDAAVIGRILGAFGLGYIVTTFLGGLWADHYGARRTLFAASPPGSACSMRHACSWGLPKARTSQRLTAPWPTGSRRRSGPSRCPIRWWQCHWRSLWARRW